MSWETRGEHSYYYRKERIGDKVVSRYVGAGSVGELVACLDEEERLEREAAAEAWKRERDSDLAIDREIDEACTAVRTTLTAVLLLTGHHTHGRQWRKQRT